MRRAGVDDCDIDLRVYDVSGRCVAVLVDGEVKAGRHRVEWSPSTGGVYFYRFVAGDYVKSGKIVVVR